MADMLDAIVIGSGPNGLAAAIVIAQTGRKVLVLEAEPAIGGGVRSAELTLPGFVHDVCSAVHPLAVASPVFRTWPLAAHGVEWIEPPVMLAHSFEDGSAAVVLRSIDDTAAGFGRDGDAYRRLMQPVVADWPRIERAVLGPLRLPRHPFALARFGIRALQPAATLAHRVFATPQARGLFGGIAAHGMQPLDRALTAGVGLVLGAMAHIAGWVMPKGGAPAHARRRDRDRSARHLFGSSARGARCAVRSVSQAALANRGGPVSAVVSPEARALPVRDGRLQGGLGARRADSLDRGGVPERRNRPRRRDI